MFDASYNNDPELWRNLRVSQLEAGRHPAPLKVIDGMVCGTHYVLGRFKTTRQAEICLKWSGYVKHDDGYWHVT